jgi:hypothetical protein
MAIPSYFHNSMKSYLLSLVLILCSAVSLSAQSTYFVDPVSGNNSASGSESTPFKSLTFALTQAVAGDTITLRSGTYATAETFPISLKDQVNIDAFTAEVPVFDGGGTGTLFSLGQDITAETTFVGVTLASCRIGIDIPTGTGVQGFTIQQCTFTGFADSALGANDGIGVLAVLSTGAASESLTIDQCSFQGGGAFAGIAIEVSGGTTLSTGGILANTSTGGVARTLWIVATEGGTIATTYNVDDNIFAGYTQAGMYLHALGAGPLLSVSTIGFEANGNSLTGTGTENGFHLRAERGVLSQGAEVSPWIRYSLITGNNVNVFCETINNGGSVVDIKPDFYGNRIENAARAGVELTTLVPAGGNDNNDPDFGPGHADREACLNTFRSNVTDFRIGAGVTNVISARFNFFPAGGSTQIGGVPDTLGILSDTLNGGFTASVLPDTPAQVQLSATSDSGFVDYSGAANVGQISVLVESSALDQAVIEELALGGGLLLQLPALTSGSKTVVVTNPGGQTGTFTLNVTSGSSSSTDSGGNDCFVATAAHGNYRSNEVLALRRFRDQYLKASPAGRGFIDWYYENGPQGAAYLLQHDWARRSTRVALALPVAVANGITRWNPGQRFAFGVLLLGLMFGLIRRRE